MREIVAGADPEFLLADPGLHMKPPKAARRTGMPRGTRQGRGPNSHKVAWIAAGLGVAAAVGILVNALALQEARHPAPLFARTGNAGQAASAFTEPTIPVPAPRPEFNEPDASDRFTDKMTASLLAEEKSERPTAGKAREVSHGEENFAARTDAISRLLMGQTGGAPLAEPSRTVLGAQKALAKLGFSLKVDGIAGLETRRAIERYERSRGLPVLGELTPKILRRLASESGLAID